MAKSGLEYFPLDVVLDDKFELIEAEFGLTGFAVIVKLFQKIYGGQGYYCEWTNEVALLFAKRIIDKDTYTDNDIYLTREDAKKALREREGE